MVVVVLLLWGGGFAYMFSDVLFTREEPLSSLQQQESKERRLIRRRELTAKLQAAMKESADSPVTPHDQPPQPAAAPPPAESSTSKNATLNVGWVSVVDPWGHQVTKIRAALIGDGWLALPTRASYAGAQWLFSRGEGTPAEISGGIWRRGEAVGLWHLTVPIAAGDGLPLAAWKEGAPLAWMSLESMNELPEIRLAPGRREGEFMAVPTPDVIREAGVFIQEESIVGWSFGPWLESSYLWLGKAGAELKTETDIRAFYAQTFANGREEKLAMALAIKGERSAVERLTALADSFGLEPKLAVEDTPDYLSPVAAVTLIRQISAQLMAAGMGAQVVGVLTDKRLLAIGDLTLFLDLVPAITASRGFEAAILAIEGVGRELVERGGVSRPAVNELHLKLYQEWLQSLVTAKAVAEAAAVLSKGQAYYGTDPYLHLLGVEIALLNGDWQEAERLIGLMEYPAKYRDRYELLSRRISEMKGDEGKIVIHFPAGANRIPVTAGLNGAVNQEFMVDTGASMVTIPSATVQALGLQVVRGDHWDRHQVSTVGGVVSAQEVLIETLEIEGWEEHNVSALVIDIPGQPGVGLLGLNYLGRFKMDLNSNEGTLSLRPK
jgi:clan AA aspartic protease (TIGR02281 family)